MIAPFLIGDKLYLRSIEEGDINDKYLSWLHDPEVTYYMETGKFPTNLNSIKAYVDCFQNNNSNVVLAIVDKEIDCHIGNVTINHINWIHRTADTGLMIGDKKYWSKGYAHEAWWLIIRYAFRRLGLRRLTAGVIDGNVGSLAVLQKLGFQVEGRQREEYWVDNQFIDRLALGLLRDEFL
jgi:[ribosomal protein S5]-alanine N-acetyltransferase